MTLPIKLCLITSPRDTTAPYRSMQQRQAEYAKAGIARYWVVERDNGTIVHWYVLDRDTGQYVPDGDVQPLAWLLTTIPAIS